MVNDRTRRDSYRTHVQLSRYHQIIPVLHRITGDPLDLAQFGALKGNQGMLLLLLAVSWVSAAFPKKCRGETVRMGSG